MQDINRRFIEAAKNGDIEIVRDILERGLPGKKMDVNAKDSTGRSALMWAACYGYPEIAKLLIEKGADLAMVSSLARHRDVRTTLRFYAAVNKERSKDIHQEIMNLTLDKVDNDTSQP